MCIPRARRSRAASTVKFCRGIHAGNAPEFLALGNVEWVGGSWLVPQDALEQGDWDRITAQARAAAGLR